MVDVPIDQTFISLVVGAAGGTVAAVVKGRGDRDQYARQAMLSAAVSFLDAASAGVRKMTEFEDLWFSEGPYRDVTVGDFDDWADAMLAHRNHSRVAFSRVQLLFGPGSTASQQARYVVGEMGIAYERLSLIKESSNVEAIAGEIFGIRSRMLDHEERFATEAGARVKLGSFAYWRDAKLRPWWRRRGLPAFS